MQRTRRAAISQETLKILEEGAYRAPSGALVELRHSLDSCIASTRLYMEPELAALNNGKAPAHAVTELEVTEETSVSAIRRLVARGQSTLCLNFASAKNPGGGFLGGAEAQEESLARASGLYGSLISQRGYYDANRACRTAFYTEHMIYSPGVPLFRDDAGMLLEQPYLAAFITAPAVNAGVVMQREPERLPEIESVMRRRVQRVLGIALAARHEALVLGAWGCGVFRNDPALIAELFADALETSFKGCFQHVVFAIFDRSSGQSCLRAFQDRLRAP